jgi:hypothetical protein
MESFFHESQITNPKRLHFALCTFFALSQSRLQILFGIGCSSSFLFRTNKPVLQILLLGRVRHRHSVNVTLRL